MPTAEVLEAPRPTLLPSINEDTPIATDAHALLHLSAYAWRNQTRRREKASQLLHFVVTHRDTHPVSCYVAAIVMLQRIWRGVICRRRLVKAFKARQLAQQRTSLYPQDAASNSDAEMVDAATQQQLRKQLRRALPWPSFSERAGNFERCRKIYQVMEVEEASRNQLTAPTAPSSDEAARQQHNTALTSSTHNHQHHSEEDALLRAMEIEQAAKTLQQRIRALLMHREVQVWWVRERWPIFFVAAVTIQRAWLRYSYTKKQQTAQVQETSPYLLNLERMQWRRKVHRRFFLTKADAAAAKVQDWWRRHLQKKIFQYFSRVIRDSAAIVSSNNANNSNYGRSKPLKPFLGSSKGSSSSPTNAHHGTAYALLKQIDYGEACMLQSQGSGLHVRFRLAYGGVVSFPPVIVFKVFTHANVVDLGLMAPKDYVLEAKKGHERRNQPIILHNKPSTISLQTRNKLKASLGVTGSSPVGPPPAGSTYGPSGKPLPAMGFSVDGRPTTEFLGAAASARCTLNKDGTKGPTPNALSWVSNNSPTPNPTTRLKGAVAGMGATMMTDDLQQQQNARYERRDNNPWRLADTKAIANGTSLEGLLGAYERAAQRSMAAAKASKAAANDAAKKGTLLLLSPALATKYGDVTGKQLVSANRSLAATANRKKAAVEETTMATQRRWLAELYASEKIFETLQRMRLDKASAAAGDGGAAAGDVGPNSPTLPLTSYHDTKVRAEMLFRNVPQKDLLEEIAKVRSWHEALDYGAYRASWLALGASV